MKTFTFKNDVDLALEHISISCDRINLVSLSEAYLNDIYREFTSEITTYMTPEPASHIDETKTFITASIANMQQKQELVVAITTPDGKFLGCAGFHGRGNCRTPELGIWLKKSAHGKKYGQEAIRHLMNWAKDNIDFDYAIYPVDRANIASRKIPESLGGVLWKENELKTASGKILDEVIYKVPV
ncbi:GNAT family N-acetyltransferase [Vibrio quintilis]|uniref:N-acetyltransferase domain-containing protein n=1 Tax=Vibrio quintilis TaxID=1117707 RepID=A0A1M7YYB0_9VIBR|nr:GNAT family N-acetyltransferase [Vibrio quintilis]SHO57543.1 hypothetical protein VQ7734_03313 [Vibrio quintilis]